MLGWRLLVLGVLGAAPAAAQLFQQFFHQGGDGTFFSPFGQSATGEQEAHGVGDASWYQERTKNAKCDTYLCRDTLACVPRPEDCPCPFKEQVRCKVGDSYVCSQSSGCDAVEPLYRL